MSMNSSQQKQKLTPSMLVVEGCRSCGSKTLETILSFGETPIADKLVKQEHLSDAEYFAPLTFVQCSDCGLAQILETVEPTILFGRDYPYYSSVSTALLNHFASSAQNMIERYKLDQSSLVMEAASNDGYMLQNFTANQIPVLGIDPAQGPANTANERGMTTLNTFFTCDLAKSLATEGKKADLFLANNVLAHVAKLNGFVQAIAEILKDDGVAVLEFPYLLDLVDHCEFDTIYHQHLCYFSLTSIVPLFERHGLYINQVERTPIHGGSLRIYASFDKRNDLSVDDLLSLENKRSLSSPVFFSSFLEQLEKIKSDFHAILRDIERKGQAVIGYGAAAKATTLLHYLEIGSDQLDCIIDKSTFKQNLYMPGTNVPIKSPDDIPTLKADFIVILAWNFAREIISENQNYINQGGQFIVPVPSPKIIRELSNALSL